MTCFLWWIIIRKQDRNKLRYSQNTRRKQTKVKKYRNILKEKKESYRVEGRTVVEWETEMSQYNKKTLNFDAYKTYLGPKNTLNEKLAPFYNEYLFRKLKLGSYMRRQITEARMIAKFKKTFGAPEDVVLCIGDWNQGQHRKCSVCENLVGVCSTFRKCTNPKPYKENIILRHGLVKCQTCLRLWNRDMNAANNIWKIATCAIQGLDRPSYLQRGARPINV